MCGKELMFIIPSIGIAILLMFIVTCKFMYRKVEAEARYHLWYRYYNRFTGKLSHEYWNEWPDCSGIEIKIKHTKDGFIWKRSWLKRIPRAYDEWAPYYEHTINGFVKCDDSQRDKAVHDFVWEYGVDNDP